MSKIKGKQLEAPENEDPQKEMEELKKIIYDFEKGVVEKYMKEKEDINMSRIKELFGVEVGEEFYLKDKDIDDLSDTIYHFTKHFELIKENNKPSIIDPLAIVIGTLEIVKIEKLILDDVEKKFIGNIIKPFDIKDITKVKCEYNDKSFIKIRLTNGEEICLPFFSSKSKMYKGMERCKLYTPEELGL